MNRIAARQLIALVLGIPALAVAQTGPPPPEPAPVSPAAPAALAAPPDLSGYWDFTVDVGERDAVGELTLGKSGDAYLGTLTTQGMNTLAIRLLTLINGRVDLIVESRDGLVTFEGMLAADGASMSGTVHYHHGQDFPMTVTRKPPAPKP